VPTHSGRTRTFLAGAAAVAVSTTSALVLTGAGSAWADPVDAPNPIGALQAPGLPAVEQLSPVIQQAATSPDGAASLLMAAAAAFAGNSAAPDSSKQVAQSVSNFVSEPSLSGPAPVVPGPPAALPSAQIDNMPAAVPGLGIPLPSGISLPGDLNQLLPQGLSIPGTAVTAPAAVVPAAAAPGQPPASGVLPVPNPESEVHVPQAGVEPGAEAHIPTGIDPVHAVGPAPDAVPAAAPAPAPAPAAAAQAAAAPTPAGGDPAPAPAYGPDSPPTQQFLYPSIGNGCLADGGNVLATALSVAGPAKIPTPGPGPGQTAYVFTAIGTPAPAAEQTLPLNVTWVNLTTGKSGSATLKPNPEINPNGPTTMEAIADTGSGSIMSTIFGQVTTTDKQCQFMPTIGSTVVP
jgi:hypothetical protein